MVDEAGHEISIVHNGYLFRLQKLMINVSALHTPEFEDFVPRCAHDGMIWPCPTGQLVRR